MKETVDWKNLLESLRAIPMNKLTTDQLKTLIFLEAQAEVYGENWDKEIQVFL